MTSQPVDCFFPIKYKQLLNAQRIIPSPNEEKKIPYTYKNLVYEICFSPDNRFLAIDFIHNIKIFDAQTLMCVKTIENASIFHAYMGFGSSMCFSLDSKFFVSRKSKDERGPQYICILCTSTWKKFPVEFDDRWNHMKGMPCRDYYLSSKYFCVSYNTNEFMIVYDTTTSLWRSLHSPRIDCEEKSCVSPDEKYIFTGYRKYDTSTWQEMDVSEHERGLFAFSPDGKLSAIYDGGNLVIYRGDVCVKKIKYHIPENSFGQSYEKRFMALRSCFSSNGYFAVYNDSNIQIFSTDTWECILNVDNTLWEGKEVLQICFSPDGTMLAVMTGVSVTILKLTNHLLLPLLRGTHSPSSSLYTMYNSDICERQVFSIIKSFL